MAATSRHTGGVNIALGDGSVRFYRNTINLAVWRALGAPATAARSSRTNKSISPDL